MNETVLNLTTFKQLSSFYLPFFQNLCQTAKWKPHNCMWGSVKSSDEIT